MTRLDEWKEWIVNRSEELCLEMLSEEATYPKWGEHRAFVDYETYEKHQERNKYRPSNHLIDEWVVNFNVESNKMHVIITNKKEVGGWNLLKLIEEGTHRYVATSKQNRMSYWYRYKKRWYWNTTARSGIRPIFGKTLLGIEKRTAIQAIRDAVEESKEEFKDLYGGD